jgi:hypothetical protein
LASPAGGAEKPAPVQILSSSLMEKATGKRDRMLPPFNLGMPAVSVEISGQSNSAVKMRDRDGSLLYQVDAANRTTTVAKRTGRSRPTLTMQAPIISVPLPDGCDGAFSPYAAPDKARVIGHCIS